ncbi:GbsR/MarR family transcriptional regulator [Rhizohabitans arisaemae]|uniref:GbsR/MarR family transcriptional regulator n=1 Tax=Rhizohabitans arisaemae TaxID=2720610 RepID=UPI0024B1593B|nr:MarR family transcriptional regulator [Rhizohabitans arisaemae]
MPGGRLTHEERRHIGTGLAEGLGYAEIARRLDRPTSTVTREVARNGGPDGYRADHAHHATGRRARRPKLTTPGVPAADGADGHDAAALGGFVERFADLLGQSGLPRMAARVLTCLLTVDSGSLTAAELVGRLQVSPASISKAITYLETAGVVRRDRGAHGRRERYGIDEDFWFRAWLTSARTNEIWADAAQGGAEILGAGTPAGARLAQMGLFFRRLSNDMTDGGAATIATDDALTVLAALVHAGTPLTPDRLSAALGWSPDRVAEALREAELHPSVTDPVTLGQTGAGAYTVVARPDRLTATQRQALGRHRSLGVR